MMTRMYVEYILSDPNLIILQLAWREARCEWHYTSLDPNVTYILQWVSNIEIAKPLNPDVNA